jgi:hypothetical protein
MGSGDCRSIRIVATRQHPFVSAPVLRSTSLSLLGPESAPDVMPIWTIMKKSAEYIFN